MENKWWIRLSFKKEDQHIIEEYAPYLSLLIEKREVGFFISSLDFDKFENNGDVYREAESLLKKLQGLILIQEGFTVPISFDLIEKKEEDGSSTCYLQFSEVIGIRTRVTSQVWINDQPVEDTGTTRSKKYGQVILKSQAVGTVMTLLAEPTYMNMYKVTELIEESYGGERKLINSGLISESKLKQLKQNLNHPALSGGKARHIKSFGEVSKDKFLPEDRLRNEISSLVKRWMDA